MGNLPVLAVLSILALATAACGADNRPSGPSMSSDGGMATDGSTVSDDGGGTDASITPSTRVDPMCVDGMYREALPNPSADISGLLSSYDPGAYQTFINDVLQVRYPVGAHLVSGGRGHRDFGGDCVDAFLRGSTSGSEIINQMSTLVHECGHFFDLGEGGFSSSVYVITNELRFTCSNGDTTSRGGRTFARSRMTGDSFGSARPPCDGSRTPGCDSYADVYLDGDPDDGTFDGGDQGFNSVLEETVQYVNSLATSYAFTGELAGRFSTSERDGILTFLWYIERYLHMARTTYPDAYDLISTDTCWRDAILTVWGRAWLYLEATDGMSHLGIADDDLLRLVTDPTLIGEIQLLRDAAGC